MLTVTVLKSSPANGLAGASIGPFHPRCVHEQTGSNGRLSMDDRVPFRSTAVPNADCRRIEVIARLFGMSRISVG